MYSIYIMSSFVFFKIEELKNALNILINYKDIDEKKNSDEMEESIKILNLCIECIHGYQEFLLKLANDNIVEMDFNQSN